MLKNDIILSKKEMILLQFFTENPTQKFYVGEIIRKLGISSSNISAALRRLKDKNFLKSEKSANALYYFLNNQNFIVRELKKILFLAKKEIKEIINKLLEKSVKVIIYGSFASGDYTEKSDIDIMVVGINIKKEEIYQILKKYEEILNRKIHPIILSLSEYEKLGGKDPAFFIEIQKGMVFDNGL